MAGREGEREREREWERKREGEEERKKREKFSLLRRLLSHPNTLSVRTGSGVSSSMVSVPIKGDPRSVGRSQQRSPGDRRSGEQGRTEGEREQSREFPFKIEALAVRSACRGFLGSAGVSAPCASRQYAGNRVAGVQGGGGGGAASAAGPEGEEGFIPGCSSPRPMEMQLFWRVEGHGRREAALVKNYRVACSGCKGEALARWVDELVSRRPEGPRWAVG